MAVSASPAVFTFTGTHPQETGGTGPWKAHVIFGSDGTISERTQSNSGNDTTTQVDAATDWVIPNSAAGDGTNFEIRMNTVPSDTLNEEAAAFGVWIDLSVDRVWGFTSASESDDDSGNLTFELRLTSTGLILATGVFSMVLDTVSGK
jgi:hypothetical protein